MPTLAPSPTPLTPLAQKGQDLRLAATEELVATTEPVAMKEPTATKKPVATVKEETTTRASCPGQPEGNLDAVRWCARSSRCS